jgi:hypothetical protein
MVEEDENNIHIKELKLTDMIIVKTVRDWDVGII